MAKSLVTIENYSCKIQNIHSFSSFTLLSLFYLFSLILTLLLAFSGNEEIAVTYFRAGYAPTDYPSDKVDFFWIDPIYFFTYSFILKKGFIKT